jgi:hypothetical protein
MSSPDPEREPATGAAPELAAPEPDPSAAPARAASAGEPVLSEQSPEDTDAGWGEYAARDDDRLYRDRPPHWDDF